MDAAQRRDAIITLLQNSTKPIRAADLAHRLQVRRQVVVGDIALLRAAGADIVATPRGYLLAPLQPGIVRTLACRHEPGQTRAELYAIVDNGASVLNVTVEHPLYGQLTGQLQLHSRYDVDQFIKRVDRQGQLLLSSLTDGVHLHTIACPDEEAFARITAALSAQGVLFSQD